MNTSARNKCAYQLALYSQRSMRRRAALVLVLALTALSARQLTCVWECGEAAATMHQPAWCHEASADEPTLGASTMHCPLSSEAAVLTVSKSSEPQRHRLAMPFVRLASTIVAAMTHHATGHAWLTSPGHAPGTPSRPLSVLRI
jgi:hypothetical protein